MVIADADHTSAVDTDRKPAVETIQSEIIRRICFREYQPGCQLKEAVLAKEFGVSRTPVRDAISRIQHLGLVKTLNGVGTVVVELSAEQIHHVYEMRLHLATLIGVMSPRTVTDEDRARAKELLQEVIGLEDDFSARRYVELNHELHNLVADLIGNSLLQTFWRQAYYQAASTWYSVAILAERDAASALVQELQDMNEALNNGDLLAVGFVQRIHIGYGFHRIKKHLLSDQPKP